MAWIARWGQGIVHDHGAWAAPMCFTLPSGESLAFVSVLLPATLVLVLVAVGGLVGPAGLSLWLGHRFEDRVARLWSLSRHPEMLVRARSDVDRWGAAGIFLGRFFGPLRATVPLIAGLAVMPALPFQAANRTSVLVWCFLVLAPGAFGVDAVRDGFA